MSRPPELSTHTVVWIFIATSEVIAYVIFRSTDFPALVRYVAGWYVLIVGFLLFAAIGITLSVLFGEHGRLDDAKGWLMRHLTFL
jgi:hypothetical protein